MGGGAIKFIFLRIFCLEGRGSKKRLEMCLRNLWMVPIDLNEIPWSINYSVLTPMPFLKNFYPMKSVVTNAETKMKSLRSFYLKTIKEHQARDCSRLFVQVGHETKYASSGNVIIRPTKIISKSRQKLGTFLEKNVIKESIIKAHLIYFK